MSKTRVAAFLVLFLLPPAAASAQASAVQKPLPPIVKKFIAAVRQAQTLSVEVIQTGHFMPRPKPDVVAKAQLRMARPNKFVLTADYGGVPADTATSDGQTLSEWDGHACTQKRAPQTLEGILAKLQRGVFASHRDAVAANVALVAFTHPDAFAALPNLQDVGQEVIDGVKARKVITFVKDGAMRFSPPLTAETATEKATYWFAADTGLPVQAVISGGFESYVVRFAHYAIDKDIPGVAFSTAPPDGLQRMSTELSFLKTGTPAPDFRLNTLDGRAQTLSALKGRVVLLAFCPSWLPQDFTDIALSLIQRARALFRTEDLAVLWIVQTDKPNLAAAFAKAHAQVPMTVLLDPPPWPQTVTQRSYQVPATPTFYVVDREGRVVAGFLGSLLDKQEAIQADVRGAAVSVLIHGGIDPNSLNGNSHLSDVMDAFSLKAVLTAAGLTGPKQ